MRVEANEREVRLRPETEWEREQLERLRNKGVERVEWEDAWDQKGDLVLTLSQHPWDKGK